MNTELSAFLLACQQRINTSLPKLLGNATSEYSQHDASLALTPLQEACLYSLTNGGKRIRASLVYATAAALNTDTNDNALDHIAAAIEMIHAYSLVHDDLPAMDNDDLRRGKPTCHIAYDEATAILVGDALQSRAFELLATLPGERYATKLNMVQTLAAAGGPRGMVGGQAIDLAAVNARIDLEALQTMHQLKTGALIRAAIAMSANWCDANSEQLTQLDNYGQALGLAFQVQDDILDIESDTQVLGKTQGADLALNKPTYPALLGLQGAKELATELHQQAIDALASFGPGAEPLRNLSRYVIARRH
ncbi:MAG: polyprenyl synthetase family protein [Spongiibacteraceae bacterium]